MGAFNFNITKIELMHSELLLLECSIGYLELLLVCYRSSTAGYPQAVQILITTVVEVASGKGHA